MIIERDTPIDNDTFQQLFAKSIWYSPVQSSDLSNAAVYRLDKTDILLCNYIVTGNSSELFLAILSLSSLQEAFSAFLSDFQKRHPNTTRISIAVYDKEGEEYLFLVNPSFHFEASLRRHIRINDKFVDVWVYALYPSID